VWLKTACLKGRGFDPIYRQLTMLKPSQCFLRDDVPKAR